MKLTCHPSTSVVDPFCIQLQEPPKGFGLLCYDMASLLSTKEEGDQRKRSAQVQRRGGSRGRVQGVRTPPPQMKLLGVRF